MSRLLCLLGRHDWVRVAQLFNGEIHEVCARSACRGRTQRVRSQ